MIGKETQAWLDENVLNREYLDGAIYTIMEKDGVIEQKRILMGFDSIHTGFLNGWQSEHDKDLERRIEEAYLHIDQYQQIGWNEVFYSVIGDIHLGYNRCRPYP